MPETFGNTQHVALCLVPTYSYHFNIRPSNVPAEIGVTHFAEVPWMMHNTHGVGYHNAIAHDPFAGEPESYFPCCHNDIEDVGQFYYRFGPE